MTGLTIGREEGAELALAILARRRSDVIARIPMEDSPPSHFYSFQKQTRKRFFTAYLELLEATVKTGDSTDFLGNETFQSYSYARNGFTLKDVLSIPGLVERAILSVATEMVERGEATHAAALSLSVDIGSLLGEAKIIRAESFTQTRDEIIRFYHSYQEEIDRFPGNLAAMLDFSTLMLSALKRCRDLVGAERCAFFTRDLLTNDLRLEASSFEARAFGDGLAKLDEPIIKKLVHERGTVILNGYPAGAPRATELMKTLGTKYVVLIPLLVRDRNVGVMLLDNMANPQMFTPETIQLAERFARRVAGAMENARLHGSEQQKLKEAMALLEVSRLVTSTLDIDVLLSRLVQITADVCEVGKCSVYIYIEENGRFYPTATFGMFPESEWETSLSDGVTTADLVDEEARAIMSCEAAISDASLSPFIPQERLEDTGVRSVLLVPISSRDRMLGLMALFYTCEREELESEDLNLVKAITGQAAVAMQNASLYEDLEMSYFSTVRALARAIEVKDPYTYGHSERVTDYAVVIAREMGLSEWDMRNIKYAAALHDIGKLGIAGQILNKPGALTEEEFLHVKTHPKMGDSIMEPVSFLKEPRDIILHHHERYDGRGYPDGLKGDEIPLGARILSVADSFEAMMSDRPYRKALDLQDAMNEIKTNAGTQFDPDVVEAFVIALEKGESEAGMAVERETTQHEQETTQHEQETTR